MKKKKKKEEEEEEEVENLNGKHQWHWKGD